jgi:hypothetical protein
MLLKRQFNEFSYHIFNLSHPHILQQSLFFMAILQPEYHFYVLPLLNGWHTSLVRFPPTSVTSTTKTMKS